MAEENYNYRFNLTNYAAFDRNRPRKIAIYGRVSTEHEAQLSALDNQMQWYDDQLRYHPNWNVSGRYIDEGITGTQAKKRPSFLRMIEDAKAGKFDLIVTREVCRFARNVVDTLVVTRELKGIGVEVFFIEDNIWTMDGDGELRLSLMATLAQEESRKVSERVRAGQQISRSNHSLYGNGNILGYDRAGDTYVVNETQAETVRMIFDWYLHGEGSLKICKHLTELHRKTATGLIKWSPPTIVRIISNGTYTGRVCYNKSRSNNFLEQHRVLNLDRSTYEYAEGNFPPIISLETWEHAQQLMQAKRKPVAMKSGKITHSNRSSKDLWVNKLRCSCGAACRKDKWHTRKDGTITYGYQCYNRLNNGSKQQREKLGLDTAGFCGIHMYGEWKLEYMARELLKHLSFDENKVVLAALDLIKRYYREETSTKKGQASALQARLAKANTRLSRLIEMRADEEISRDEYKAMRAPVDEEIVEIKKEMESENAAEQSAPDTLNIEQLEATLRKMAMLSPDDINLDLIDSLVYRVTPTSDTRFEWYLHLSRNADAKAAFSIDGKKSDCSISLEEIIAISSLHIFSLTSKNDAAENSPLSALLYRRHQAHSPRHAGEKEIPHAKRGQTRPRS